MFGLTTIQILLFVVATILLLASIFLASSTQRFIRSAQAASGKVVDNLPDVDSDGDTVYKPRFVFTLSNGEEVSVQSQVGTSPPSFRKGQSVTVLYDPSSPQQARINSFMQLWGGAVILIAVAVIFLVVGFCLPGPS
jgi:hypothetical protein